jgi:GH35 family endo-1,4-beta-xylanase
VDWTRANNATGGGGGVTYVEAAFVAAHAADPGAKLFFNEYAVHGETTKFEYMFAMLADFVGRGVPCHGVGLQTHVQNAVAHKAWNETGFRNVLRRLTVGLGLEVHVTELNVPTDDPMYDACAAADAPCREGKLAALYVDVLRVCMEFAGCKSFETWGFTDAHSSYGARLKPPGAFLYDAAYAPKPVRAALAKQLASTPTPFPTPPPSPPTPAPPTPPPTPQVCAAAYGRCAGGPTWSGPTCCDGSCTCVVGNPTYSQCKPPAGSHAC